MTLDLPVIDLELGAELLSSTREAAIDMIKELIIHLRQSEQDLAHAYAAADLKKICSVAHYIHGGAAFCGTPRLKEAAFALEKAAHVARSLQEIDAPYQALNETIQLVISEGGLLP